MESPWRHAVLIFSCCLWLVFGAGCATSERSAHKKAPLRIATSYSLDDSGLFPVLASAFERETSIQLKPSFVGSDKALALGRAGQADVVLVHSRKLEDAFVLAGFGINRRDVMHSEYVLVGPPGDPAQIRGARQAVDALKKLAAARAPFLSRADGSGNHTREQALWTLAGVKPEAPWYVEAHAGMLDVLRQAGREGAYALTDRPTFIVNRAALEVEILIEGDSQLHNPYGVIAVNPLRVPGVAYEEALRFIDFLCGAPAQARIRDFGREKFGEPLFSPFLATE